MIHIKIKEYPFQRTTSQGRNYADKEKIHRFVKDGFTTLFAQLVQKDKDLLQGSYIKRWYNLSITYV